MNRACVDFTVNLSCSNCGKKLHVAVDGIIDDGSIQLSFAPCLCYESPENSSVSITQEDTP